MVMRWAVPSLLLLCSLSQIAPTVIVTNAVNVVYAIWLLKKLPGHVKIGKLVRLEEPVAHPHFNIPQTVNCPRWLACSALPPALHVRETTSFWIVVVKGFQFLLCRDAPDNLRREHRIAVLVAAALAINGHDAPGCQKQ